MVIAFDIPELPAPKQGDRSCIVAGRIKHYQSSKVTKNADVLRLLAAKHRPVKPMTGPVRVEMEVRYPWRKSEPKKNRVKGWKWKSTRPDVDQLAKQTLDVLQSLHYFTDDAQVVSLLVEKQWSDAPGLSLQIEGIG